MRSACKIITNLCLREGLGGIVSVASVWSRRKLTHEAAQKVVDAGLRRVLSERKGPPVGPSRRVESLEVSPLNARSTAPPYEHVLRAPKDPDP